MLERVKITKYSAVHGPVSRIVENKRKTIQETQENTVLLLTPHQFLRKITYKSDLLGNPVQNPDWIMSCACNLAQMAGLSTSQGCLGR